MLDRTTDEWRAWTRGLATPLEWQEAVIRAAITLKLCQHEETGAIVAALTTSIPEYANSGRNWDYRRSEEHTSELQSLMRNSYAVFCLKQKKTYSIEKNIYRLVDIVLATTQHDDHTDT